MTHTAQTIRNHESLSGIEWPAAAQSVAQVGDAWVLWAGSDFDLADLNLVRRQLPDRRVTLDGDTLTVWPRPREHQ